MGLLKHHNVIQCSIHCLGSLEEKDPCAQYQLYISRCKKCMVSYVKGLSSVSVEGKTMENNGLKDKRKRLNHYRYDHYFWCTHPISTNNKTIIKDKQ